MTNKYITAAEIANQAMAHAVSLCVPGAFPGQVGDAADKFIADATSKIFNNKVIFFLIVFFLLLSLNIIIIFFFWPRIRKKKKFNI